MASFEMANLSSSIDRFLISSPRSSNTLQDLPTIFDMFIRMRTELARFIGDYLRHLQHVDLSLLKFAARIFHEKMKQLLVIGPLVGSAMLWSDWEASLATGFGVLDLISDPDRISWSQHVNSTCCEEIHRLQSDERQFSAADIVRGIKKLEEVLKNDLEVLADDKVEQRNFLIALRALMKRSDYLFSASHIPHELLRRFFNLCIEPAGNLTPDALEAFENQSYEQQFQLPLVNIKERFNKVTEFLSEKLKKSIERKVTATSGKRWYRDLMDYHNALVAFHDAQMAPNACSGKKKGGAEEEFEDDDLLSGELDDDDDEVAAIENEALLNVFNVLPLPHPLLPRSSINRRRTAAVESLARDKQSLRAFLLEYSGVLDASFGAPQESFAAAGIPPSHMKKLLRLLHHVPCNGGESLSLKERVSLAFDITKHALTFQLLGQRVVLEMEAHKREARTAPANKEKDDTLQQQHPQLEANGELLMNAWDALEYALQFIKVEQESVPVEERCASSALVSERVASVVSFVVELIDFHIMLRGSEAAGELVTLRTIRAVWQTTLSHIAGADDKARRVALDEGVHTLLVEMIPVLDDDHMRSWLIQCCRGAIHRICRDNSSHCTSTMDSVRHAMKSTLRSTALPPVVYSALRWLWVELEECYGTASMGLFAMNFEPRADTAVTQSRGTKRERE